MFGFAQSQEKRKARADVLRAERAFDAARMQPLIIQQDIARRALRECAVTIARLSEVAQKRERETLYRLRLAELDHKIEMAELDSHFDELEPPAIAAILTQTVLATSSGSDKSEGLDAISEKIAKWARNILPDFPQYAAQLVH